MNQWFDLGKSFTLSLALNFGLEHLSDFLLPFFSGYTLLFSLLVRAPTPFASTSTLEEEEEKEALRCGIHQTLLSFAYLLLKAAQSPRRISSRSDRQSQLDERRG